MEYQGVDTIRGLAGAENIPQKITVSYELLLKEQLMIPLWNAIFVAILPYCFACKESLIWHVPSDGGVLFHCPKCKREWVKDGNWPQPPDTGTAGAKQDG